MKKNYITNLLKTLFIAIPVFTASAQVDLNNGLLVHFKFSGNADDSSGNTQHGSVTNATLTTDRVGNANSAFSFDGSTSFISFPSTMVKTDFFSYSIWVSADEIPATGKYSYPFAIGGTGGGSNIALTNNSMQGWSAGSSNNGSPALSLVALGSQPNTNKWYHVVLVRDSFKIKLYVNGVLNTNESTYSGSNTSTGGNSPIWGTSPVGMIGARSQANFFKGKVDDIRIYGRAINIDEIDSLYHENEEFFTGIRSAKLSTLSVYPNPTSGFLTINSIEKIDFNNISIYNSLGQKMNYDWSNYEHGENSINISLLTSGLYILKYSIGKYEYISNFIVD